VLLLLNALADISIDVACTSVVVRDPDGSLLRSRNLDLRDESALPGGLYFFKPVNGHAFVSISHQPGFIGNCGESCQACILSILRRALSMPQSAGMCAHMLVQ